MKLMNLSPKILLIFTLIIMGCDSIKKTVKESYRYEMYIDYKYISYQGHNSTQKLYLAIDSTKGMWYYGKLIIDKEDTVKVYGFEKGNHYVTMYKEPKQGRLEIWCRGNKGQILDSLTIKDADDKSGIILEKTVLYRHTR